MSHSSDFRLSAVWTFPDSLHIGSGLARPGFIDKMVRRDAHNRPELPADAVKGAIRLTAERLDSWFPQPADWMKRVFQCGAHEGGPQYRFHKAVLITRKESYLSASTAIEYDTGLAKSETLRITEKWARGVAFRIEITGRGGGWTGTSTTGDNADLVLLCAAMILTEGVGGKRGAGVGAVECTDLQLEVGRPLQPAEVWPLLEGYFQEPAE